MLVVRRSVTSCEEHSSCVLGEVQPGQALCSGYADDYRWRCLSSVGFDRIGSKCKFEVALFLNVSTASRITAVISHSLKPETPAKDGARRGGARRAARSAQVERGSAVGSVHSLSFAGASGFNTGDIATSKSAIEGVLRLPTRLVFCGGCYGDENKTNQVVTFIRL